MADDRLPEGTASEDLTAEDRAVVALPPDACVLEEHDGYAFTFFIRGGGDDPLVYVYNGDGEPSEKDSHRLTEWLRASVSTSCDTAACAETSSLLASPLHRAAAEPSLHPTPPSPAAA